MKTESAGLIGIMIVSCMMLSCRGETISAEEEMVLNSLKAIQSDVGTDLSLEKYMESVADAKSQIDRLKRSGKAHPCFLSAVQKCQTSYEIAGKAWHRKITEKDPQKKADMDMTMSFSLSFASLEIEKAGECFSK